MAKALLYRCCTKGLRYSALFYTTQGNCVAMLIDSVGTFEHATAVKHSSAKLHHKAPSKFSHAVFTVMLITQQTLTSVRIARIALLRLPSIERSNVPSLLDHRVELRKWVRFRCSSQVSLADICSVRARTAVSKQEISLCFLEDRILT
jgi:hypothetical protein